MQKREGKDDSKKGSEGEGDVISVEKNVWICGWCMHACTLQIPFALSVILSNVVQ